MKKLQFAVFTVCLVLAMALISASASSDVMLRKASFDSIDEMRYSYAVPEIVSTFNYGKYYEVDIYPYFPKGTEYTVTYCDGKGNQHQDNYTLSSDTGTLKIYLNNGRAEGDIMFIDIHFDTSWGFQWKLMTGKGLMTATSIDLEYMEIPGSYCCFDDTIMYLNGYGAYSTLCYQDGSVLYTN